eukprot:CAMPEP_0206027198 /NCGR_PEP_ID=MMETSP1464-20131121/42934_1 /ASSEMBLY_ACC=CAM_ASM_001124 /TAXON_ID=119497 /ORGANISM="Exanthemachrysis gayraliae, Strain RCC1523" /LENGTH=194 /DNA_ID=CAMNT_0053401239 /DNA_START=199 /DNA_END=779 /DNA_ORIENTATION=+
MGHRWNCGMVGLGGGGAVDVCGLPAVWRGGRGVHLAAVGRVVARIKGTVPPLDHDGVLDKVKDVRHVRRDAHDSSGPVLAHDVAPALPRLHAHQAAHDRVELRGGVDVSAALEARAREEHVEAHPSPGGQVVNLAAGVADDRGHLHLPVPGRSWREVLADLVGDIVERRVGPLRVAAHGQATADEAQSGRKGQG